MSDTITPTPHGRNKEALREFQSRLAERLQLTQQSTGVAPSWLAVEVGGRAVLFPLNHTGEVFPWTAAAARHVPYVKPWFLGVANLRGGLFGVADLEAFLLADAAFGTGGGQAHHPPRTGDDLARCWLVTLNPLLEAHGAVLVDQLMGLRTTESFTRSSSPAAGLPDYFGHVYTDAGGREWQEINLQLLSRSLAFLSVGV